MQCEMTTVDIVVDVRTEHRMKSPTGIVALVVGDSKSHVDMFQCEFNLMIKWLSW